jgi:hypothetical protein
MQKIVGDTDRLPRPSMVRWRAARILPVGCPKKTVKKLQ